MPENQASEIPSRLFTAPPGLRLVDADAAGVCADGHCSLPPAQSTSIDAGDAQASGADAD